MTKISFELEDIFERIDDIDLLDEVRNRNLEDEFQTSCDCEDEDWFKADTFHKDVLYKAEEYFRSIGEYSNADRIKEVIEALR